MSDSESLIALKDLAAATQEWQTAFSRIDDAKKDVKTAQDALEKKQDALQQAQERVVALEAKIRKVAKSM